MSIFKRNSLIAIGLLAALPLTAVQAQTEHDGHHPGEAPSQQAAPEVSHAQKAQGGMSNHEGMGHGRMDHDQMMQMHKQHMGSGQMDQGSMDAGPHQSQGRDDKSPKHDH
ncbi:hypothetical protein [Stutzerimonas xanthomarina]|uniref:hypothetical protein n=1 Tax=Stutzerimonas xanthomarina TaxID=271420 RepID=UPI003AA82F77